LVREQRMTLEEKRLVEIHADEQKATDKMQGFGQEAKEKIGDRAGKVKEPERRP
jgi:hypothetical protein